MTTYSTAFTEAVCDFRMQVRYIESWGNFAWEHKPPNAQNTQTEIPHYSQITKHLKTDNCTSSGFKDLFKLINLRNYSLVELLGTHREMQIK